MGKAETVNGEACHERVNSSQQNKAQVGAQKEESSSCSQHKKTLVRAVNGEAFPEHSEISQQNEAQVDARMEDNKAMVEAVNGETCLECVGSSQQNEARVGTQEKKERASSSKQNVAEIEPAHRESYLSPMAEEDSENEVQESEVGVLFPSDCKSDPSL